MRRARWIACAVTVVGALAACMETEEIAPTDSAPSDGGTTTTETRDDAAGLPAPGGPDAAVPEPDAGPAFVLQPADVNHVLSTGQSLSVGAVGSPALSTAQPFENLMFVTGVLAGGTGLTSLVPLVEANVETMSAGLANLVTQLGAPQGHRLLVSCHGVGGIAYAGLKKGTTPYANGIAQVKAARDLTKADGRSYLVRVVTNVHGESDHIAGNAGYLSDLVTWQQDYETDVQALTGQSLPVPMLHTQMSSWTKYGQATSAIPGMQLAAHVGNPGKIVLVGAKYHLAYVADGVHLTNAGYRHMGEYYAKVYRRVVLEGKAWEPVRPKSATLAADEIRIEFHVPVPPLAIDTTLVPAAAAYGFEYTDASGAPPAIASVTLDGPTAVKVKLAAVPVGVNKRIRYAFTGTPNAAAGGATGPRGNLRDSDATASRSGQKLYNWAVHFDQPL